MVYYAPLPPKKILLGLTFGLLLVHGKCECLVQTQISGTDQNGRIGDEYGRIVDENRQFGNENGRIADKNGRIADENGRIAHENGRIADENGRFADENGRIADDNGRIGNLPAGILCPGVGAAETYVVARCLIFDLKENSFTNGEWE